MSLESAGNRAPELTPEQAETRDLLLEFSKLKPYEDIPLTMMGQTATIGYGLGRCGEYLLDMTPEELRSDIFKLLDKAGVASLAEVERSISGHDAAIRAEIEASQIQPTDESIV